MVLVEVGAYLQAQGFGTVGQTIFLGARPATPDTCVTVQLSPPLPNLGIQEDSLGIEQPRLQVVCRGVKDDYLGPYTQANLIYKSLQAVINQNLSGIHYLHIDAGPPFEIGSDPDGRWLLSVNCEVMKVPS